MAENVQSLRCLRIQIEGFELLLPNSIVAEVIAYQPVVASSQYGSGFLGQFIWRGVQVPLLSLELLCEQPLPRAHVRARIAVLYHPDGNTDKPYLGLLMQDIPRPQTIEEGRLQLLTDHGPCDWVDCCVEYDQNEFLIPKVSEIFEQLG